MCYETTRARAYQTYQERENRTHNTILKTLDILFTTLKPAPSFFLCVVETPIFDARRPTTKKVDDDDDVAVFFSRGASSFQSSRGSTPFVFFLWGKAQKRH